MNNVWAGGTWQETLKARDISGNAVALDDTSAMFFYDTVLDITWLADWNYAKTSGYDTQFDDDDGRMAWDQANTWATTLTVGTFGGWQLPTVFDINKDGCDGGGASYGGTDCGYNVYSGEEGRRDSPLAHMFYDTLGNLAFRDTTGTPQDNWGLANTGPFRNMQGYYWSGTATDEFYPEDSAWAFIMSDGNQTNAFLQISHFYTVAVRSGDVLVNSIPEPGSVALLSFGLVGLALNRRSRFKGKPTFNIAL